MKHHDNKTQPLGKQSVPDVSCGLSYKHEPWATAFKYLTQHGCTQRLAELIEGKSHIPREARKLLAQYLRGEVTVKSPDHKIGNLLLQKGMKFRHDYGFYQITAPDFLR